MASLWFGLLEATVLVLSGIASWWLNLYLRGKGRLERLSDLFLALFIASFLAALTVIGSMWYAGEECLADKSNCFRFGLFWPT
jgi:hypothetical protein